MKLCMSFLISLFLVSCNEHIEKGNNKKHIDHVHDWKFIMTETKQHFLHLTPCDSIYASFHYENNTDSVQVIDAVKVTCS